MYYHRGSTQNENVHPINTWTWTAKKTSILANVVNTLFNTILSRQSVHLPWFFLLLSHQWQWFTWLHGLTLNLNSLRPSFGYRSTSQIVTVTKIMLLEVISFFLKICHKNISRHVNMKCNETENETLIKRTFIDFNQIDNNNNCFKTQVYILDNQTGCQFTYYQKYFWFDGNEPHTLFLLRGLAEPRYVVAHIEHFINTFWDEGQNTFGRSYCIVQSFYEYFSPKTKISQGGKFPPLPRICTFKSSSHCLKFVEWLTGMIVDGADITSLGSNIFSHKLSFYSWWWLCSGLLGPGWWLGGSVLGSPTTRAEHWNHTKRKHNKNILFI